MTEYTPEQMKMLEEALGDGKDWPSLTKDPVVNFLVDLELDVYEGDPTVTCWDDLTQEEKDNYTEEAAEHAASV